MATNKNEHWLNVVFGETPYEIPGVEGLIVPAGTVGERPAAFGIDLKNGLIRYNTDNFAMEGFINGEWRNFLVGETPTVEVVDTINDLQSVPTPVDGDLSVVKDNSGEEELYVYNSANTDLGLPLLKWRMLATTESSPPRVNFRNQLFDASVAVNNIGDPVLTPYSPFVKEINVDIQQAFNPGRTLQVQEGGASVLMSTAEINPQLVGTYQKLIPGSWNADPTYALTTTGQIQAVQGGGTGGPGLAVVYVKYVVQV